MTVPAYPPAWWITVPEIATDLQVTDTEFLDWAAAGHAPVPEFGPDHIGRIHRADYEAWLDSLPTAEQADIDPEDGQR